MKKTINWYKNNPVWWKKINKIVIAGARETGHAGVVLKTLEALNEHHVAGFLDNELVGKEVQGLPVIGKTDNLPNLEEYEAAIVAIGDNESRGEIAEKLKLKGLKLLTIIHPSAIISNDVLIGEGTFIGPGVVINNNVKIGNNAIINMGSTIDHDSVIGNNAHMAPGVNIGGRARIGNGSYMGLGSKVLPDIIIGNNSMINAGEIVSHNIDDNYGEKNIIKDYTHENIYHKDN